jgi:lytic murein transglycosylase
MLRTSLAVMVLWLASACGLRAQTTDAAFKAFLAALKPEAVAAGVAPATFDKTFAAMTPDRSLPDLEIPGVAKPSSGGQAEFSKTPLQYLDAPYLTKLEAQGKQLAITHAATLGKIEQDLGVERHVLLAIWGRETAFGAYKPTHNVIRSLATQAWLGRRKDMFRAELIAALRMVEAGVLTSDKVKGSWAGAMGLTQFMPTEFFDLAYDLDGDGRKDIWGSVPDALASAANQLKAKGWIKGQPWGVEVVLPKDVDCRLEGPPAAQTVAEWLKRGVVRADGKSFASVRLAEQAFLLTPGGAYGPTFLVFENFMVLKRYNFADLYAVFVGTLSDRIAGGGDFKTRWTTPPMITNRDIEELQGRLRGLGFAVEKVDGKAGMNTRRLIGAYQASTGRPVDCWPSAAPLADLRRATTKPQ